MDGGSSLVLVWTVTQRLPRTPWTILDGFLRRSVCRDRAKPCVCGPAMYAAPLKVLLLICSLCTNCASALVPHAAKSRSSESIVSRSRMAEPSFRPGACKSPEQSPGRSKPTYVDALHAYASQFGGQQVPRP
jgi:hypothetical protein